MQFLAPIACLAVGIGPMTLAPAVLLRLLLLRFLCCARLGLCIFIRFFATFFDLAIGLFFLAQPDRFDAFGLFLHFTRDLFLGALQGILFRLQFGLALCKQRGLFVSFLLQPVLLFLDQIGTLDIGAFLAHFHADGFGTAATGRGGTQLTV